MAAGHEGSGLTMALSTAEIVAALLDGKDGDELQAGAVALGLCSRE
jgi:glycine/D-amino acid oxidase-like deaminating enzyme